MKKILIVALTTSMLGACSSPELATGQIKNEAILQASLANITPEQAIKDTESAFTKATEENLFYYTPLHFKDIKKTLAKIETLQKNTKLKNKSDKNLTLITTAFTAQKLIIDAYKVKSTILVTLAKPLEKLQMLENLGAKDLFEALSRHTQNTVKKTQLSYFHFTEKNQKGSSFGERFTNAIQSVYDIGFEQIITIGNDSPHLQASQILETARTISKNKAVLGPSKDGGFYLMGLHKATPQ